MMRVLLFVSLLMLPSMTGAQAPASAPPAATSFYSVSYIEVTASARSMGIAALERYGDAAGTGAGFVRVELFEQAGRPGHFALVETWRDQAAFEGRGPAPMALRDALQPIRLSDIDQRPYKPLTVASAAAVTGDPIIVLTHVDVSPDPRVAILLTSLAETSRREPGNLRFDVLQHTMRANHFTVIETWRNRQALEAHAGASHTRQYRDQLQPMTGSPLDERLYTAIGPNRR